MCIRKTDIPFQPIKTAEDQHLEEDASEGPRRYLAAEAELSLMDFSSALRGICHWNACVWWQLNACLRDVFRVPLEITSQEQHVYVKWRKRDFSTPHSAVTGLKPPSHEWVQKCLCIAHIPAATRTVHLPHAVWYPAHKLHGAFVSSFF